MLNELYTLDQSLKTFNVVVAESHPWVKRLGRTELLIAGLDDSGVVTSIEHLDKEAAVTLFKIQESNHKNFPAVNWSCPILDLDPKLAAVQEWLACSNEDVRKRVELLRKACADAVMSSGQTRLLSRTQEFCGELALRFLAGEGSEFEAFPVLIRRLLGIAVTAEAWTQGLAALALRTAEAGSLQMLGLVETLLAGEFDNKANEFRPAKVSILFDLADCTKFRYRVANPKMGGYFSRRLNATEASAEDDGVCALTGRRAPLQAEPMPKPLLPVLGPTVLMSMNPDTPCQKRYGRIGNQVFPAGRKTVFDLNAALVQLTKPDRKGKNWMPIPGMTKKKSNLLLVYLESSPGMEDRIAELFSGADQSDELYSELCEEVCKGLRARAAKDSDLLHVLVLNKVDPGRVQVELNEAFTAEQVIGGSEEWRRGARNRPAVTLQEEDYVPSPTDVMRCLQMKWERGGASHADASGCRLAEVFDVLIAERRNVTGSAAALLGMTLRVSASLLAAIGHATHRGGKEAWRNFSRDVGRNPAIVVSLLGITLNKLGYRKETYMQEPAFLVGRFLSLADTLHAEYSKEVRKDLPPQLLGNALIPTAISDPGKGIARMGRLRVYQAWAKKKGTPLARWSCGEIGRIAAEVAAKLPNRRLNDAEQAQLLLGYLARAEKEERVVEEGENQ